MTLTVINGMEDIVVKYADRAFCYAVCAYLLWKDRVSTDAIKAAMEGVKDALVELKNAINVMVTNKVQ